MTEFQDKLAELMAKVPYEKVREDAMEVCRAGDMLKGEYADIGTIMAEVEQQLAITCGDILRDIDKLIERTMKQRAGSGMKEWYASKLIEGYVSRQKETVSEMTMDLESIDIGGSE